MTPQGLLRKTSEPHPREHSISSCSFLAGSTIAYPLGYGGRHSLVWLLAFWHIATPFRESRLQKNIPRPNRICDSCVDSVDYNRWLRISVCRWENAIIAFLGA